MFKEIFFYEIKRWLRLPLFYIYFFSLMIASYVMMIIAGGVLENATATVSEAGYVNSPAAISQWVAGIMGTFGIFLIPSLIGSAAYRDFQYNIHSLFFTTRINKPGYLLGRFFGSMIVTFLVFTGIAVGLWLGTVMPFVDETLFGPNSFAAYSFPYFTSIFPNIFFYGAVVFALGLYTRSTLATYIAIIVLFILNNIGATLAGQIDYELLGAMLDPTGAAAASQVTKYWTITEQNTMMIPLEGTLLYNRLLWSGAGIVFLFLAYAPFRFNQTAPTINLFARQRSDNLTVPEHALHSLPKVVQDFSPSRNFSLVRELTRKEFGRIIKGPSFIILTLVAALFMFIISLFMGQLFGTTTYPVTYQVLEIPGSIFRMFALLIIYVYSGVLVNRERELKISNVLDTYPIPDWVMFCSKLFALFLTCGVLLLTVMGCGMLIQVFNGYYNFELSVYLRSLFCFELINYLLIATLAMFIQTLVRNKYWGFFILLGYFVFANYQHLLGIEQKIFKYAGDRGYGYSDMNGYGHTVWPFFLYKLYWAGLALVLAVLSSLVWVRGVEGSFRWRLKAMKLRSNMRSTGAIFGGFAMFGIGLGAIINNTHFQDNFTTAKDEEKGRAEFEKKYKQYEGLAQPRITDVNVNVNFFPYERAVNFNGYFFLKNKHETPISDIHIVHSTDAIVSRLDFDRASKLSHNDSVLGYRIYKLDAPLAPGDSIKFNYGLRYEPKGFRGTADVFYNGTFVNSGLLPSIGYNPGVELTEDRERKQYGLEPKKQKMLPVDDPKGLQNNYITSDADWVTFEAIVSTVPDQIAIAPGYLQKEWTDNGRRYFHYKMDSRTLHFFSFQSAAYEVLRDKWNDVNIEIYYHKGHEYNLGRMVKGIKESLDYYTKNFSPYQHKQVRILEFPRYQMFAQSFANTIPFSEAIGFIAKVDDNDPKDVDYPYYVTAHEVAHQWWAHQVIGGNTQGTTLLTETMSQYSALMVMEKEYGRSKMKRFLRHELNQYLLGRSHDKDEKPLMYNENQQYIHYNKGSLAMYALRDYIGEDTLNAALKKYVKKVAFTGPPYTNTKEFISYIKAATPDSLQYLVTDLFETITFYYNKTNTATWTKLPDGRYKVRLEVESKKVRAENKGAETEVDFTDYIDIGIMGTGKDGKEKELYLQKHKIRKGKNTIEVIVSEEPNKAGIDPYSKLIERSLFVLDDNVVRVQPESGAVANK
jgi:ABC-2 type transport system permease protein